MLFIALTAACAALAWRARSTAPAADAEDEQTQEGTTAAPWRERLRWIALAFVPSSLMMGVTTALTTDVPAIPLFWVLPLALYLLSFVLVFATRPPISHPWLVRRLPFLILVTLYPALSKTQLPLAATFLLYLSTLFAVALVCHGELAHARPGTARLTEFYLWISVGGVLGGIFNALIAPVVFSTVAEFPLALIFAALLRPPIDQTASSRAAAAKARRNDLLLPIALGLCMTVVILTLAHFGFKPSRPLNIAALRLLDGLVFELWQSPAAFRRGSCGAGQREPSLHRAVWAIPAHRAEFFRRLARGQRPSARSSVSLPWRDHPWHHRALEPTRSREPLAYYTRRARRGAFCAPSEQDDFRWNWRPAQTKVGCRRPGSGRHGLLLAARRVADLLRDRPGRQAHRI